MSRAQHTKTKQIHNTVGLSTDNYVVSTREVIKIMERTVKQAIKNMLNESLGIRASAVWLSSTNEIALDTASLMHVM